MPLNKQGKRIQAKNLSKIPETNAGSFTTFSQGNKIISNNSIMRGNVQRTPILFGDKESTTNQFIETAANADPFSRWLRENSITTISNTINSTATVTSINISTPEKTGGADYLLRKGDSFYLYDQFSFNRIKLTADADLLYNSTAITITSTAFKKGKDVFRSGSYVIYDNKHLVEIVSSSPRYKKYSLDNATFTDLHTTPYTLLAAETGKVHLPSRAYIILNQSDRDTTNSDLFIGWSSGNSSQYWAKLSSYSQSMRHDTISEMVGDNDENTLSSAGIGDALYLYMSADLASPANTITIHLWYNTIVA